MQHCSLKKRILYEYPAVDTQALTPWIIMVLIIPCIHAYKVRNTTNYYHHGTYYINAYVTVMFKHIRNIMVNVYTYVRTYVYYCYDNHDYWYCMFYNNLANKLFGLLESRCSLITCVAAKFLPYLLSFLLKLYSNHVSLIASNFKYKLLYKLLIIFLQATITTI